MCSKENPTLGGLEVKPTLGKRVVVSNAFSVNMIASNDITLRFKRITLEDAKQLVKSGNYYSIVGHEGTALLLSNLLGVEIPTNRINYVFNPSDMLLVFTIPIRLPEGRVLTYEEIRKIKDSINIFMVEVV